MVFKYNFKQHSQWSQVSNICERLSQKGFLAYLAGGCVRDALLGVVPKDFDIATSATPEEVGQLFPGAVDVGKSFGVMVIPFDGFQVEVASFRKDGLYIDGRRPETVEFSSPEEDAHRRDFTVNALFYDPQTQKIHDFVGGLRDLEEGYLKTVGSPQQRFQEDHLRLMRAIRFSAQLGFQIEEATLKKVFEMHDLIQTVSKERIKDEFLKFLKSKYKKQGLELLKSSGLLSSALPDLESYIGSGFWEKTLDLLQGSPEGELDEDVLWSLFFLFYNFQGSHRRTLRDTLKTLKLSNKSMGHILDWTTAFWFLHSPKGREGEKRLRWLNHHQVLARLIQTYELGVEPFPKSKEVLTWPTSMPERWVSAENLLALGFSQGPELGEVLEEALLSQLEGRFKDQKEALDWARSLKNFSPTSGNIH